MLLRSGIVTFSLLMLALTLPVRAQEWSEDQVIQRFLQQSPQTRELRAHVAIAQAEARGRALYPNPSFSYSREGAGFNEFFEVGQILPISGRLGYLRQAGTAAVSATKSQSTALLWELRGNLRIAFYRLLAAQQQQALVGASIEKLREIVRILRDREREGEGSRYDRLRGEREIIETRTELTAAQVRVAQTRSELLSFLPAGTQITRVTGQFSLGPGTATIEELVSRALMVRGDYRAEQQEFKRYGLEKRTAERLLIPELTISAGLKRAETLISPNQAGAVVSLSLPIPLFNRGRTEVMRFEAQQRQADARRETLAQQIRAQVEGAYQTLLMRQRAVQEYGRESGETGAELTRIAQLAYQEGEIGILELLDAYRKTVSLSCTSWNYRRAPKKLQSDWTALWEKRQCHEIAIFGCRGADAARLQVQRSFLETSCGRRSYRQCDSLDRENRALS
jgi:outer membrane protein, heavy metal efflux system